MENLSLRTRESFEAVMKKYAPMVYRLAYSRTGNTYDADDVFQDVFLRYIKADKTFNDEEHRKAFLIKVTLNCSKSFVTSAWKRHTDFYESDENRGAADPRLENLEKRSDVLSAVMKLSEKYRTAVYLFYYEDLTIAEIARITSSSEAAVKVRLSRARTMLKSMLEGVQFDV